MFQIDERLIRQKNEEILKEVESNKAMKPEKKRRPKTLWLTLVAIFPLRKMK
ncbi:hypothetical protein [Planococcus sp. YIM B11945]|uniref:hypothetical protein n=1 Tax=Planococcus sp. YIM B11945 TaxID=3435410 RepID=UPI003D7E65E6